MLLDTNQIHGLLALVETQRVTSCKGVNVPLSITMGFTIFLYILKVSRKSYATFTSSCDTCIITKNLRKCQRKFGNDNSLEYMFP